MEKRDKIFQKGKILELATKLYLENKLKNVYPSANVYFWEDWARKNGFDPMDIGIDLVVEVGGELWGVQSKNWKNQVDWNDLSTFFTSLQVYRFKKGILVVRSGLTSVAKRNIDKLPIKIDVIVVRNNLEFEPFLKKAENIILGVQKQNTTSYQQKQQQTTSSYQRNQQEEKKIYTTPYRVTLTSPPNLSTSTPQQKSEVKEKPAEDKILDYLLYFVIFGIPALFGFVSVFVFGPSEVFSFEKLPKHREAFLEFFKIKFIINCVFFLIGLIIELKPKSIFSIFGIIIGSCLCSLFFDFISFFLGATLGLIVFSILGILGIIVFPIFDVIF
jgi:hypothetical protein